MSAALDRIAALLAKAERTEIEAEADAYLMKAQQLATLASVDLAVARARTARREARQQPESRTTTIGEKGRPLVLGRVHRRPMRIAGSSGHRQRLASVSGVRRLGG